jgi:hypothetical protein
MIVYFGVRRGESVANTHLGIMFLHKDDGELHLSQTRLIDAVTDSANIPKGDKKHQHQQHQYYMPTKKALDDNNHGIIHQSLDN